MWQWVARGNIQQIGYVPRQNGIDPLGAHAAPSGECKYCLINKKLLIKLAWPCIPIFLITSSLNRKWFLGNWSTFRTCIHCVCSP